GFVLPNYTKATPHGSVTSIQAAGIIVVTLAMYFALLLIQIGRHKHFFEDSDGLAEAKAGSGDPPAKPDKRQIGKLSAILVVSVVPILLMGKYLTTLLDYGSSKLGAPPALGGVILALIVISPKMISAVKAGIANQPQRSANLALGSCAPA